MHGVIFFCTQYFHHVRLIAIYLAGQSGNSQVCNVNKPAARF